MTTDWHALYDDVKRLGEFSSDAQVAEGLGLTRAQISAWRTGKSELGTLAKLRMLDALGQDSLRAAVLSLLPHQNRALLEEQHLAFVARVSRGQLDAALANRAEAKDDAPFANSLLAALPAEDQARIAPHLSNKTLPLGAVVYEPGDRPQHIYLPATAVFSMLHVADNGATTEIAVIGRDGLLGIAAILGGEPVPSRAVVQTEGLTYCLDADFAKEELARGGQLQDLVLRFSQALITQMAQTAICNRHHPVFQQFCRWLLLSLDRLDTNALPVTDEMIAELLGVNPATVSEVAGQLQSMGAIRYDGRRVEVLDRRSIEALACSCYHVVRREYARLLRGA
ncbi:CRP-like cAMP-binding protein [Paraburkholderia sp. GAS199]|uniref:Crp/Fnr family transcriptional regulator n=1 Tax=Paraburkholderia sp. GAS199 TaxID=3035126 RepID=UPI003D1EBC2B